MTSLTRDPIRLVEFTKSFHLGGTEGQVLELLRSLPSGYQVEVAVLERGSAAMHKPSRLRILRHLPADCGPDYCAREQYCRFGLDNLSQ